MTTRTQQQISPAADLHRTLARLFAFVRRPQHAQYGLFDHARTCLAALPLATEDYALAMNRIRNAETYLANDERGAARFELMALARSVALRSIGNDSLGTRAE